MAVICIYTQFDDLALCARVEENWSEKQIFLFFGVKNC